jgi:hypothetical protein
MKTRLDARGDGMQSAPRQSALRVLQTSRFGDRKLTTHYPISTRTLALREDHRDKQQFTRWIAQQQRVSATRTRYAVMQTTSK